MKRSRMQWTLSGQALLLLALYLCCSILSEGSADAAGFSVSSADLCPNRCDNAEIDGARTFQRCLSEALRILEIAGAQFQAAKRRCRTRYDAKVSEGFLQNGCTLTGSTEDKRQLTLRISRTCVKEDFDARLCDVFMRRSLCTRDPGEDTRACCEPRNRPGQFGNPSCPSGNPGCCAEDASWQCPIEDAAGAVSFRCGGAFTTALTGLACESTTSTSSPSSMPTASPVESPPLRSITVSLTPTNFTSIELDSSVFGMESEEPILDANGFSDLARSFEYAFDVTGDLVGTMMGKIRTTIRVDNNGIQIDSQERLGGILLFSGFIVDPDAPPTVEDPTTVVDHGPARYLKVLISAQRLSSSEPFVGSMSIGSSLALDSESVPPVAFSGRVTMNPGVFPAPFGGSTFTGDQQAIDFGNVRLTVEPTSQDDAAIFFLPIAPRDGTGMFPAKSLFVFRPEIKNIGDDDDVTLNKIVVQFFLDAVGLMPSPDQATFTIFGGSVTLKPGESNNQLVVNPAQNVLIEPFSKTPPYVGLRFEFEDIGNIEVIYETRNYNELTPKVRYKIPVSFLAREDFEIWTTDAPEPPIPLVDEERFGYNWELVRYLADTDFPKWTNRNDNQGGTSNSHYRAWDQPVFAMESGVVVKCVDGIDDNLPGVTNNNPNERYGNHVVVRHFNRDYVFYALLRKGSVIEENGCEVGELVSIDTQLGNIGNSGFSPRPHLLTFSVGRKPAVFLEDNIPNTPVPLPSPGIPSQSCNESNLDKCHLRPLPIIGATTVGRGAGSAFRGSLPDKENAGDPDSQNPNTFVFLNGGGPSKNSVIGPVIMPP